MSNRLYTAVGMIAVAVVSGFAVHTIDTRNDLRGISQELSPSSHAPLLAENTSHPFKLTKDEQAGLLTVTRVVGRPDVDAIAFASAIEGVLPRVPFTSSEIVESFRQSLSGAGRFTGTNLVCALIGASTIYAAATAQHPGPVMFEFMADAYRGYDGIIDLDRKLNFFTVETHQKVLNLAMAGKGTASSTITAEAISNRFKLSPPPALHLQ